MPSLARSRWVLASVLAGLSVLAIAATWGRQITDDEDSYVPRIGSDIREPALVLGSAGLGGLMVMRSASVFLPKPWKIYIDRIEFSFVSMLWLLWTSGTMAFSASTISQTICRSDSSAIPKCSILTFDLFLLHLLSIACFAYLVVVLSTALSPGYYTSLSTSLQGSDREDDEGLGEDGGDVFVMWELALGESPQKGHSALPGGDRTVANSGYGTTAMDQLEAEDTSVPTISSNGDCQSGKFARGRVGLYVPLIAASLAAFSAICAVSAAGYPGLSAMFVLFLSVATAVFITSILVMHYRRISREERIGLQNRCALRRYRAIELGGVLALFVLWPIAATLFTLNPSSNARPCTSKSTLSSIMALADVGGHEALKQWLTTCNLTLLTLAMSWSCGWLALARAVNLAFPMPETLSGKANIPIISYRVGHSRYPSGSGEGQPLLTGSSPRMTAGSERPQVKWGRIVAGEAFELGDDEN